MEIKKVKIQTIFISKPQWEAGWPYIGYDNEQMKKFILDHLNQKFPDIQFSSNEVITNYDKKLIEKIKEDIEKSDGVLIYTIGHYGDPGIVEAGIEIIKIGKPTILINIIYGGDHTFTKIYTKIKGENLPIYPISSQNIEDFDDTIEIMHNILQIRGKKILIYASESKDINWKTILDLVNLERKRIIMDHPEFIEQVGKMSGEKYEFYTDLDGFDQAHQWRKDENKYQENLKEIFGVELQKENPDVILSYYDKVEEEEAKKIAKKWINNAKKVQPTEKTIINSAKLYLAFKKILTEKKGEILAPDCGTLLLLGKMPAYPCMAFFELTNERIYGICESDLDCAISYLFGLYLTNRPGFVSNHTLDLLNNQITYLHCVAANRLYGVNGPSADFDIVYHGETHIIGASPRVKFPIGQLATTIKISIFERKIAIRQGKIIDNIIDDRACVSKMLVEGDTKKILDNYDWDTFGWHRVTFVGDWKDKFIIGAKILGLEVVEEDK
ncbi:MAG: hypothetical protein ACFFAQ_00915 [Promethearchaeota archaeon]